LCPWGCALFFIAIDELGTQIYITSPSGIYQSFKSYALGSGEAKAREYLTANYKPEMDFDDLMNTMLRALKESIDEEATKENIRLAYIKSEDKKLKMCSKEEVEEYLSKLK
jgi:20S proteasome alpha/beta subunit